MLHKAELHCKHHKGQILMGGMVSDDIQLATDGHKNVSGELKRYRREIISSVWKELHDVLVGSPASSMGVVFYLSVFW
jgi:hypothetical protein